MAQNSRECSKEKEGSKWIHMLLKGPVRWGWRSTARRSLGTVTRTHSGLGRDRRQNATGQDMNGGEELEMASL